MNTYVVASYTTTLSCSAQTEAEPVLSWWVLRATILHCISPSAHLTILYFQTKVNFSFGIKTCPILVGIAQAAYAAILRVLNTYTHAVHTLHCLSGD